MWRLPWELHPCAQYEELSHPSPVPLPLQLGLCRVLWCGSDWAIHFQSKPKPSGVCNDCSEEAVEKCMIIPITLLQVYIVIIVQIDTFHSSLVERVGKEVSGTCDLMSMREPSERGGYGAITEVVWGTSWIVEWEVTQNLQAQLPPMEETHLWFPFSRHTLDFS